jgi:hypothetical protein
MANVSQKATMHHVTEVAEGKGAPKKATMHHVTEVAEGKGNGKGKGDSKGNGKGNGNGKGKGKGNGKGKGKDKGVDKSLVSILVTRIDPKDLNTKGPAKVLWDASAYYQEHVHTLRANYALQTALIVLWELYLLMYSNMLLELDVPDMHEVNRTIFSAVLHALIVETLHAQKDNVTFTLVSAGMVREMIRDIFSRIREIKVPIQEIVKAKRAIKAQSKNPRLQYKNTAMPFVDVCHRWALLRMVNVWNVPTHIRPATDPVSGVATDTAAAFAAIAANAAESAAAVVVDVVVSETQCTFEHTGQWSDDYDIDSPVDEIKSVPCTAKTQASVYHPGAFSKQKSSVPESSACEDVAPYDTQQPVWQTNGWIWTQCHGWIWQPEEWIWQPEGWIWTQCHGWTW